MQESGAETIKKLKNDPETPWKRLIDSNIDSVVAKETKSCYQGTNFIKPACSDVITFGFEDGLNEFQQGTNEVSTFKLQQKDEIHNEVRFLEEAIEFGASEVFDPQDESCSFEILKEYAHLEPDESISKKKCDIDSNESTFYTKNSENTMTWPLHAETLGIREIHPQRDTTANQHQSVKDSVTLSCLDSGYDEKSSITAHSHFPSKSKSIVNSHQPSLKRTISHGNKEKLECDLPNEGNIREIASFPVSVHGNKTSMCHSATSACEFNVKPAQSSVMQPLTTYSLQSEEDQEMISNLHPVLSITHSNNETDEEQKNLEVATTLSSPIPVWYSNLSVDVCCADEVADRVDYSEEPKAVSQQETNDLSGGVNFETSDTLLFASNYQNVNVLSDTVTTPISMDQRGSRSSLPEIRDKVKSDCIQDLKHESDLFHENSNGERKIENVSVDQYKCSEAVDKRTSGTEMPERFSPFETSLHCNLSRSLECNSRFETSECLFTQMKITNSFESETDDRFEKCAKDAADECEASMKVSHRVYPDKQREGELFSKPLCFSFNDPSVKTVTDSTSQKQAVQLKNNPITQWKRLVESNIESISKSGERKSKGNETVLNTPFNDRLDSISEAIKCQEPSFVSQCVDSKTGDITSDLPRANLLSESTIAPISIVTQSSATEGSKIDDEVLQDFTSFLQNETVNQNHNLHPQNEIIDQNNTLFLQTETINQSNIAPLQNYLTLNREMENTNSSVDLQEYSETLDDITSWTEEFENSSSSEESSLENSLNSDSYETGQSAIERMKVANNTESEMNFELGGQRGSKSGGLGEQKEIIRQDSPVQQKRQNFSTDPKSIVQLLNYPITSRNYINGNNMESISKKIESKSEEKATIMCPAFDSVYENEPNAKSPREINVTPQSVFSGISGECSCTLSHPKADTLSDRTTTSKSIETQSSSINQLKIRTDVKDNIMCFQSQLLDHESIPSDHFKVDLNHGLSRIETKSTNLETDIKDYSAEMLDVVTTKTNKSEKTSSSKPSLYCNSSGSFTKISDIESDYNFEPRESSFSQLEIVNTERYDGLAEDTSGRMDEDVKKICHNSSEKQIEDKRSNLPGSSSNVPTNNFGTDAEAPRHVLQFTRNPITQWKRLVESNLESMSKKEESEYEEQEKLFCSPFSHENDVISKAESYQEPSIVLRCLVPEMSNRCNLGSNLPNVNTISDYRATAVSVDTLSSRFSESLVDDVVEMDLYNEGSRVEKADNEICANVNKSFHTLEGVTPWTTELGRAASSKPIFDSDSHYSDAEMYSVKLSNSFGRSNSASLLTQVAKTTETERNGKLEEHMKETDSVLNREIKSIRQDSPEKQKEGNLSKFSCLCSHETSAETLFPKYVEQLTKSPSDTPCKRWVKSNDELISRKAEGKYEENPNDSESKAVSHQKPSASKSAQCNLSSSYQNEILPVETRPKSVSTDMLSYRRKLSKIKNEMLQEDIEYLQNEVGFNHQIDRTEKKNANTSVNINIDPEGVDWLTPRTEGLTRVPFSETSLLNNSPGDFGFAKRNTKNAFEPKPQRSEELLNDPKFELEEHMEAVRQGIPEIQRANFLKPLCFSINASTEATQTTAPKHILQLTNNPIIPWKRLIESNIESISRKEQKSREENQKTLSPFRKNWNTITVTDQCEMIDYIPVVASLGQDSLHFSQVQQSNKFFSEQNSQILAQVEFSPKHFNIHLPDRHLNALFNETFQMDILQKKSKSNGSTLEEYGDSSQSVNVSNACNKEENVGAITYEKNNPDADVLKDWGQNVFSNEPDLCEKTAPQEDISLNLDTAHQTSGDSKRFIDCITTPKIDCHSTECKNDQVKSVDQKLEPGILLGTGNDSFTSSSLGFINQADTFVNEIVPLKYTKQNEEAGIDYDANTSLSLPFLENSEGLGDGLDEVEKCKFHSEKDKGYLIVTNPYTSKLATQCIRNEKMVPFQDPHKKGETYLQSKKMDDKKIQQCKIISSKEEQLITNSCKFRDAPISLKILEKNPSTPWKRLVETNMESMFKFNQVPLHDCHPKSIFCFGNPEKPANQDIILEKEPETPVGFKGSDEFTPFLQMHLQSRQTEKRDLLGEDASVVKEAEYCNPDPDKVNVVSSEDDLFGTFESHQTNFLSSQENQISDQMENYFLGVQNKEAGDSLLGKNGSETVLGDFHCSLNDLELAAGDSSAFVKKINSSGVDHARSSGPSTDLLEESAIDQTELSYYAGKFSANIQTYEKNMEEIRGEKMCKINDGTAVSKSVTEKQDKHNTDGKSMKIAQLFHSPFAKKSSGFEFFHIDPLLSCNEPLNKSGLFKSIAQPVYAHSRQYVRNSGLLDYTNAINNTVGEGNSINSSIRNCVDVMEAALETGSSISNWLELGSCGLHKENLDEADVKDMESRLLRNYNKIVKHVEKNTRVSGENQEKRSVNENKEVRIDCNESSTHIASCVDIDPFGHEIDDTSQSNRKVNFLEQNDKPNIMKTSAAHNLTENITHSESNFKEENDNSLLIPQCDELFFIEGVEERAIKHENSFSSILKAIAQLSASGPENVMNNTQRNYRIRVSPLKENNTHANEWHSSLNFKDQIDKNDVCKQSSLLHPQISNNRFLNEKDSAKLQYDYESESELCQVRKDNFDSLHLSKSCGSPEKNSDVEAIVRDSKENSKTNTGKATRQIFDITDRFDQDVCSLVDVVATYSNVNSVTILPPASNESLQKYLNQATKEVDDDISVTIQTKPYHGYEKNPSTNSFLRQGIAMLSTVIKTVFRFSSKASPNKDQESQSQASPRFREPPDLRSLRDRDGLDEYMVEDEDSAGDRKIKGAARVGRRRQRRKHRQSVSGKKKLSGLKQESKTRLIKDTKTLKHYEGSLSAPISVNNLRKGKPASARRLNFKPVDDHRCQTPSFGDDKVSSWPGNKDTRKILTQENFIRKSICPEGICVTRTLNTRTTPNDHGLSEFFRLSENAIQAGNILPSLKPLTLKEIVQTKGLSKVYNQNWNIERDNSHLLHCHFPKSKPPSPLQSAIESTDEETEGGAEESETDVESFEILKYSLECLLEVLVQRGKIRQAFVADLNGGILAKTEKWNIQRADVLAIDRCLMSTYQGIVKLNVFSETFTCVRYLHASPSLTGKSDESILAALKGSGAIVVGLGFNVVPGSCIKEIEELAEVLRQRGLY
ncbi:hypothetical protein PoB_000023100 [Plakobranchus ocellatus]|uniref:Tower domain-containing protein n=1 Tax=Plakobranchus ocellatus TaxID=259542 RepID=A0AAV3XRC0_9GAST|nr:hypothetical protein PoB_000023100 [Plakobranchus ocellatus]